MAARKKTATGAIPDSMVASAQAAVGIEGGVAYASVRIKEIGHKLRFSHSSKLIEATDTQTVTFLKEPFPHFRVDPGGVEFPLENVTSAMQVGALISQKLSRTGRMKERAERLRKLAAEKQAARKDIQVIDDEDDEPLADEVSDD
jgi:hypothetical protein